MVYCLWLWQLTFKAGHHTSGHLSQIVGDYFWYFISWGLESVFDNLRFRDGGPSRRTKAALSPFLCAVWKVPNFNFTLPLIYVYLFVNSFPINKGSAISQRLLSNITGKKLTWQCLVFNALVMDLSAYKLFSKSSLQVFGGSEMGRNYHWVSWNWYILMLIKRENFLTKLSHFM